MVATDVGQVSRPNSSATGQYAVMEPVGVYYYHELVDL